jgi:hypothetical protein
MAAPEKPEPGGDLSVFFSCHQFVISIPTRRVERLMLADEVRVCRPRAGAGAVPVVQSGNVKFAAWNLGRMVELPVVKGAWILLRLTHEGAELPMALGVGRCLFVGPQRQATALPPGAFKDRRSALWATFPTAAVSDRLGEAQMGFCLDPLRLWKRTELEQSAAAILAAHSE